MDHDSSPEARRGHAIRRVLTIEMLLNLAVAAAKAAYGMWSGSLAVATDAVHSVVDAAANLVGFVAIRIASSPPDEDHPYGHRKFEIIAAAGIGVAIGGAAVKFAWDAISGLADGAPPPKTSTAGFAVIIGTWVVNIFVAAYEARRARQLESEYLAADAAHTASDVFVTAAVLGSFTAAHYGVAWADPVGALIVVVVIAHVAWRVLASNFSVLVDQAVVPPGDVEAVVISVDGVRGCHRIRSRGSAHAAHVDLHIQLDGHIELTQAHDIAHAVEDRLREEIPLIVDVTVHMEPEGDANEDL